MPNPNEIVRLEKKISQLIIAIGDAERGNSEALKKLLLHIRNPGWTTPAELAFSHLTLDAVLKQVQALDGNVKGLLKFAGLVSKAS